jgi:hypothetical protein
LALRVNCLPTAAEVPSNAGHGVAAPEPLADLAAASGRKARSSRHSARREHATDIAGVGPEPSCDFDCREARPVETNGFVAVDDVMLPTVGRRCEDSQVLGPIVELVAVEMMDMAGGIEGAEGVPRDHAVFEYVSARPRQRMVRPQNGPISATHDALELRPTMR